MKKLILLILVVCIASCARQDVKIGDVWEHRILCDDNDPFDEETCYTTQYIVFDVKDGYVKFKAFSGGSGVGRFASSKLSSFTRNAKLMGRGVIKSIRVVYEDVK